MASTPATFPTFRLRAGERATAADRREALEPLIRRVMADLHASAVIAYLMDAETRTLVADVVVVTPLGVGAVERVPVDDPIYASAAAYQRGELVTARSVEEIGDHPRLAAFAPFPFTVCAVPLFAEGRRFGALAVYWPMMSRTVDDTDRAGVENGARAMVKALERLAGAGAPMRPEPIPRVVAAATESSPYSGDATTDPVLDAAVAARAPLVYHLNKLAVQLNDADQTSDAVEAALERLSACLSATSMALLLVEVDRLRLIGAKDFPNELLRALHGASLAKQTPETDAAAHQELMIFDTAAELEAAYAEEAERGERGWAVVPLTAGGRVVGVCSFSFDPARRTALDDRALLSAFGELLGQCFERTRLHDAYRTLANQLQQALLPTMLPHFAGVLSTARYLPATSGIELGGDWYDVFNLPDGRVGAVIGDVQGHNIAAAVVMGQLRSAVRSYAAEGHDPSAVLTRANRLLVDLDTSLFATCCCVWVDSEHGVAEIATAGHEPPMLGTPDGAYEPRERVTGIPLGIEPDTRYRSTRLPLRPGDVLTLYTDGLVATRDPVAASGADIVSALLAEGYDRELETLADDLVERGSENPRERVDDIALLLLRYEGRPADTRRYISQLGIHRHDTEGAQRTRAYLRGVLEDWELAPMADEIELLASEVVTNAIVHCDTDVDVRMRRYRDRVRVEVHDSDPHLAVPVPLAIANDQAEGGRGLVIVSALASTWGNSPSGRGKTVWFELRTPGAENLDGDTAYSRSPRGDHGAVSRAWRRVRARPQLAAVDGVDRHDLAGLTPVGHLAGRPLPPPAPRIAEGAWRRIPGAHVGGHGTRVA